MTKPTKSLPIAIDRARWWTLSNPATVFYGSLATHLVDVLDESIPTAATDGKRILWNPDFVARLTDEEVRFVLLHEALRAYAEKLADPDKIFRDSLITNLADILNLAADLNLGNDPKVAELVEQARTLAAVDPDQLREDKTLRADSAVRAADLCSLFSL